MRKLLCLSCAKQEQVEDNTSLPDCCPKGVWLITDKWSAEKLEKTIKEIKGEKTDGTDTD